MVPNLLTISRIPLGIAFWFAAPRPWLAFAVIAAAGFTDVLDGWLARRATQRSTAGSWLDPVCDKTFAILVLAALVVRLDVPVGVAALIATRELLLVPAALAYRLVARFTVDFTSAISGKRATIAQFLAVLAIVFHAAFAWVLVLIAAGLGAAAAVEYLQRGAAAWRVNRLRP